MVTFSGSHCNNPDSDTGPPDVDAECLHTLKLVVDSYARVHPAAERLLASLANLDWLSQDLVYGPSLPDEKVHGHNNRRYELLLIHSG